LKLAGGKHIDGVKDYLSGHAAGFSAASVHGAQFLDYVPTAGGRRDCQGCHTNYDSCATCHSSAAGGSWTSWETNCTFCHGAPVKSYTAANLVSSAPQDVMHGAHVARYGCTPCHTVPTGLGHIGGSIARAEVTLSAVGAIPAGTYDPATKTCATYCHGSTLVGGTATTPTWSPTFSTGYCTGCHASPPQTGRSILDSYICGSYPDDRCSLHEWHYVGVSEWHYNGNCDDCHTGNAHVNGVLEIAFPEALRVTGPGVVEWHPVNQTCTVKCHDYWPDRPWN
jgi:predicted CxxxxCH...CXXCH cytochrome family protein